MTVAAVVGGTLAVLDVGLSFLSFVLDHEALPLCLHDVERSEREWRHASFFDSQLPLYGPLNVVAEEGRGGGGAAFYSRCAHAIYAADVVVYVLPLFCSFRFLFLLKIAAAGGLPYHNISACGVDASGMVHFP